MEYRSSFHLGPSFTSRYLKILLLVTGVLSLFSSWLIPYLALSLNGVASGFFWQFITYVLIHPFPIGLFQLAFNLYLIWVFGSSLIERIHIGPFFILYFGSALFSGIFAFSTMSLTDTLAPLMGSSPVIFSLLISWALLNPNAQLFLFFTVPVKARHLVLGLIGITFLMNVSNTHWVAVSTDLSSLLFGYLFTLTVCRVHSFFGFLRGFENTTLRFLEKISSFGKKSYQQTKVYDIKSGAPVLNDEQFMDAMLARISLYGEESLTPKEKQRMHEISEKKSSKKKS